MSSTAKTVPDVLQGDPVVLIAQSTAGEIGVEFLAALVRSVHQAMDVTVAVITRGVGEPPERARAAFSWKQPGTTFPDEYDLEGTPCRLVYEGQTLMVPEQLWKRFPIERGKESYCGVPLRSGRGKVIGHFSVFSETPIRDVDRVMGVMALFGRRVEAELQRIDSEREREEMLGRLTHALDRLNRQHELTRRANQFKTEVLGMVAHDLRSPLAAIITRAELIETLLGRASDSGAAAKFEQMRTSCEAIGRAADRMTRMISDLLASAREETRAISLKCRQIDVASPARTAIGLNRGAAEAKRLRLEERLDVGITVVADEDRLIEAIDNLISNAVKYSAEGGTIVVAARLDAAAGAVFVTVTDQGEGMSEDDLTRAFQRFQQLSAKPTGGEQSIGLGLAIVKSIAEAHGGSVEVASTGKGRGAMFSLRLPIAGPPPGELP